MMFIQGLFGRHNITSVIGLVIMCDVIGRVHSSVHYITTKNQDSFS